MSDPVVPFRQAALPAIIVAGRYRPERHRHHDGFLQHAFATSPWLGVTVVVLIALASLVLALLRKAGRALERIPWYVRAAALLATAGFGIFWLFSRQNQGATQPAPPRNRAWPGRLGRGTPVRPADLDGAEQPDRSS